MRRQGIHVFALVGGLLGGACTSIPEGARERFSERFSCPLERVEARERKELSGYDVIFGAKDAPPPEIASDPGRVAMWKKKNDETKASWDRSTHVVEVRGCDKQVLFTCSRPTSKGARHSVSCTEQAYPAGVSRW